MSKLFVLVKEEKETGEYMRIIPQADFNNQSQKVLHRGNYDKCWKARKIEVLYNKIQEV